MGDTLEIQRMQQAEAMEQQLDEMWGRGGGVLHWGEEWEDSCPRAPELKAQHVVCQGGS